MPYLLAPDEQTHVAAMLWLGDGFDVSLAAVARNTDRAISHEQMFHTLLDIFEIETEVYAPSKSLLREAQL